MLDKLRTVENKLDQLLVLQEQSVDTTVRPPLKPKYLDIIDVSRILEVEQRLSITGFGRVRSLTSKLMVGYFSFGNNLMKWYESEMVGKSPYIKSLLFCCVNTCIYTTKYIPLQKEQFV